MTRPFSELRSVAEFVNGAAFKPEDWEQTGARIIRIQNLTDTSKPFNRTTRAVPDKVYVRPGDILVSWSASLGVFEWNEPDTAVLNQHIFRVIPDESRIDRRYLRHGLVLALQEMQKHLHGATMQHVNRNEFLSTKIYVPPLPEQRRIAAILDKADELRAKRQSALAQADAIAQAIFENLFGSVRTPTASRTVCLGDALHFVTSGSRGWAEFYSPTGSRFIRSLDVQMNRINDDDAVYVKAPDTAEARRTKVETGDVLLTITGSRIGRVAPVSNACADAYISQHVAILRPIPSKIVPEFLSFFLSLDAGGQQQIARMQYGQTKPGLNFEQIKRFRIPLPPLALQSEFARRLTESEHLKSKQQQSLAGFSALFTSLQHQAFSGEL